jgi:hypothetical protein
MSCLDSSYFTGNSHNPGCGRGEPADILPVNRGKAGRFGFEVGNETAKIQGSLYCSIPFSTLDAVILPDQAFIRATCYRLGDYTRIGQAEIKK